MIPEIEIDKFGPFKQGGVVLVFMLLFIGVGTIGSENPRSAWVCVCAMMLFFALFNTIMSIPVKETSGYWWKSILTYVLLAAFGGLIATNVSGLNIDEAGSTRWIYVVFSIGYLVFISIVNLIKLIIFLAQRQDERENRNL